MTNNLLGELLDCNETCIKSITKYVKLLREADVEKDKDKLGQLISKLLNSSDNLIHNSRQIPLELGITSIDEKDVYDYRDEIVVESSGIKIDYVKDNWLGLRLPAIPPKRNKSYSKYLLLPLQFTLSNFFSEEPFNDKRKMVLIYRFVYSSSVPTNMYLDYDNLEVKMITDVVTSHTIISDHPTRLNTYCCSIQGEETHTEVFLIPEEEFPFWLEWEKTISKEGILT